MIPIAEGDTVYFRVSDLLRPVGGTVVVSGKTEYEDPSEANRTKSGSIATSPGETDELDLVLEIEGQTSAKVYKGRRNVKIDYQGG
ncbi:hypothetical protein [Nannocystis pusilla]|uniref:hypothetical protein n=1 Tax=Nannocystis pusilla TaxID=889268 RepID=UPI001CC96FA8|nr:hypothetical protein [Nannocystis pusilla]